jgi:hypothetical protein
MIKTFEVHLKDGRTIIVGANEYVLDKNGQYTFSTEGSTEVQWFKAEEVSGITERKGGATVVTPGHSRGRV